MKHVLFFLGVTLLISCENGPITFHNFKKTIYRDAKNWHFDKPDYFFYDNIEYAPILGCNYKLDTLNTIVTYRSEGYLNITVSDIIADPILSDYLALFQLPRKQTIILKGNNLTDGLTQYKVEIRNDTAFCVIKDSLIVFVLEN